MLRLQVSREAKATHHFKALGRYTMQTDNDIDCVFCINTGRVGSSYLKHTFQHVENRHGVHEGDPIGYAQVIRSFSKGRPGKARDVAKAKQITSRILPNLAKSTLSLITAS